MTRKEAVRINAQADTLVQLGFTYQEAESLRRISMTLHTWSERECNGEIERSGDDADGPPYRSHAAHGGKHLAYRIPDRERGALKRLVAIIDARNARLGKTICVHGPDAGISYYVQGDPRGASLYIIRPGDVPEGANVDGYYSRGIAVY